MWVNKWWLQVTDGPGEIGLYIYFFFSCVSSHLHSKAPAWQTALWAELPPWRFPSTATGTPGPSLRMMAWNRWVNGRDREGGRRGLIASCVCCFGLLTFRLAKGGGRATSDDNIRGNPVLVKFCCVSAPTVNVRSPFPWICPYLLNSEKVIQFFFQKYLKSCLEYYRTDMSGFLSKLCNVQG